MEKSEQLDTQLANDKFVEEKYNEIRQNGIGMGIIVCLRLYKSLNLQSIADLLDRRKNTVLHQVKNLLEARYIDLDVDRMRKESGKYYKTGPLTIAIFDYAQRKYEDSDMEFAERLEGINQENMYDRIVKQLKSLVDEDILTFAELISNINRNIESVIFNQLDETIKSSQEILKENPEDLDQKLIELAKQNNWGLTNIGLDYFNMKIYNLDQAKEFATELRKFMKKFLELERKFQKENDQIENLSEEDKNIGFPVNQYLYMFTAPLDEDTQVINKSQD